MASDGAAQERPRLRLLTADEVAAMLSVHKTTVYNWAAQGHLPCIVLAQGMRKKCVRFHPDDVKRFIEEGRLDPTAGS